MAIASTAWKFRMPGETRDVSASGPADASGALTRHIGPRISVTGGVEMVSDAQAVRQSILMLLHTTPGERLMRPEYGCGLRRLLFSPNDDTTAGLAIHLVRAALERWEPRIDVVLIDATRDPDRAEVLLIELQYRLHETQEPGALCVPLNLNGG